ncbi:MAG: hypothetical protein EXR79_17480 [Myxococcales bacterium]|nr:hypothetical protein [Myxococcales bacterium]
MIRRSQTQLTDGLVVAALFVVAIGVSWAAMRSFREAGAEPFFYQSNFEPAVMMACGRGFGVISAPPAALTEFLHVRRNDFDCALLSSVGAEQPLTSAANANWYYMYAAAAAVWRVAGVSWTALDWLVAAMSGVGAVMLYGLFRLIAGAGVAASVALVLTLSPANLTKLLSLRDYSKAPFVLAAVLVLAALVLRPLSRRATLALAAVYGVVVGVGYGFRPDLAVMVPFGAVVVLVFLPGTFRLNAGRNALAAALLLVAFFASAWPVISALNLGGCQYHFSLLGLTEPLTNELRLTPPVYRLGEHMTDAFADLKTGDYAARVLGAPVPALCTAEYDTASGALYFDLARTFPADLAVRAYASVLMILRVGLDLPAMMVPMPPFAASAVMPAVYRTAHAVTSPLAALGVVLTVAAMALAAGTSLRLGLALIAFVLFLTGYPAIRFDERHWFHLRFIPWWTAIVVLTYLWRNGVSAVERPRVIRAGVTLAALLVALAAALGVLRVVQDGRVRPLLQAYLDAPTDALPFHALDVSTLQVDWQPRDEGVPPFHRGTDLLAVTLDAAACAGDGGLGVTATYEADNPARDLSTTLRVSRPAPGAAATRLFIPVFWQGVGDRTELRFSGLRVAGAPVACVGRVARVSRDPKMRLWLDAALDANWMDQPLYQAMRAPRLLNR